jgi:hypothetical protein
MRFTFQRRLIYGEEEFGEIVERILKVKSYVLVVFNGAPSW